MDFPFWLIPIIAVTIFLASTSENKKNKKHVENGEKKKRAIFMVLVGLGLLALIIALVTK